MVDFKRPVARDAFGPFKVVATDVGDEPSLTQQQFMEECDITNILKRYETTGVIDHATALPPQYGDFSNVMDYHSALNAVLAAEEYFNSFPAKFRRRFNDDAGQFLEFLADPANAKEIQELGFSVAPSTGAPEVSEEVIHGSASADTHASEATGG